MRAGGQGPDLRAGGRLTQRPRIYYSWNKPVSWKQKIAFFIYERETLFDTQRRSKTRVFDIKSILILGSELGLRSAKIVIGFRIKYLQWDALIQYLLSQGVLFYMLSEFVIRDK